METLAYFLNHREFASNSGKVYRVLTVCDMNGNVSEYYHNNESHNYDSFQLFQPIALKLAVSNYKGRTHLDLLDAYDYKED